MDEALLDLLPGGCLIIGADDSIEHVNQTLLDWLGRDAGALVGKRFVDLLPLAGKLFYANQHAVYEQLAGEVRELSYELITASGELLPVLVSSRPIGGERRVYLVFRAVLRRGYEAELLAAKKAADEANRARATFLSTVTHEVRTPIHAVVGIAELLEDTPLTPEQLRLVRMLRSSGENLLHLINDVLDLSRAESGVLEVHPVPTDLAALVTSVVASLRVTVPRSGVELVTDLDPACPDYLLTDAGKVRQVLTNLVGNAIKFTDAGEIRVRLRCLPPERGADDQIAVELSVSDTGRGIPLDRLARIFEPFEQVHEGHEGGTGLGLAISRRLAEALGGTLTAESALGSGSRFALLLALEPARGYLPPPDASAAPAADAPSGAAPPEAGPARGDDADWQAARVLVVDDNDTNLFIARRQLRALGVQHALANGGAEALELAAARSFDLVLLDLRMPGMNGYEVARRLRELPLHGATPVLAVTAASLGHASPTELQRERALFVGRLLKPFTRDALAAALREHARPPRRSEASATDAVEFATLDAEFAGADDRAEYRELLDLMIAEFESSRERAAEAARGLDRERLADLRHKLNSSLTMLSAQRLAACFEGSGQLRGALAGEALAARIGRSFDDALRALRRRRAALDAAAEAPGGPAGPDAP